MANRKPFRPGMLVVGMGFVASGLVSPLIGIELVFGSVLGLAAALMVLKEGASSARKGAE